MILCTHILENPLNISMPNSQDLEKKPLMFVVPFSFCKGRSRRKVVFKFSISQKPKQMKKLVFQKGYSDSYSKAKVSLA